MAIIQTDIALPAARARENSVHRYIRRHPTIVVGAVLLLLMTAMAVFAPWLGTVDPQALAPVKRLKWPSAAYWFGTDMLGRDVYSRTIYGARVSLVVGISVALLSTALGLLIGVVAGFTRWVDAVVMRIMDGLMSIPAILIAIALMALSRASLENVVFAITVAEVPRVTRLVRGIVLTLREQPYVEAAIASGTPFGLMLWRHIVPNTLPPLLVQGTFVAAAAMITEAILSFIGAGTPPNIPSWGNIMAEGRSLFQVAYYIVLFPGIMLSLTVLAMNLLGDGLRDALDPRLARRLYPPMAALSEPVATIGAAAPTPALGAALRPLLEIADLRTWFFTRDGIVRAVDGISFRVMPGETLAIVGESGCGKSVTALSILRLVPMPPGRIVSGRIEFAGRNLLELSEPQMRDVRGNDISMIFQEPMTSLNPVLTVGRQIAETLVLHQGLDRKAALDRAVDMLRLVHIPEARRRIHAYPHQLSGGMRQRVMIAMALACNPKLLIADEPTTALDVTIQAQILDLMRELKQKIDAAIVLITHDLGVVAEMAQRVVVMYAGRKAEEATVRDLFRRPLHPYTRGLLASVPRLGASLAPERLPRLAEIRGTVPSLKEEIAGCPFAERCAFATGICRTEMPVFEEKAAGHYAACFHSDRMEAA